MQCWLLRAGASHSSHRATACYAVTHGHRRLIPHKALLTVVLVAVTVCELYNYILVTMIYRSYSTASMLWCREPCGVWYNLQYY